MAVARAPISSHRHRQHANDRHRLGRAAARVFDECRFERGVGELVDAERAHQRMMAHARRRASRRPDDDAGLWAAEQLVAAERHDVGAGAQAGLRRSVRRASGGRPAIAALEEAAAEVFRDRHVELTADGGELVERRARGEAFDREVGRMDAQEQRRAIADRRGVVGRARAVGRADLAERRAGLRASRRGRGSRRRSRPARRARRSPRALRQRRQHQQRRRGVVVDDDGGLGAGEVAEQRLGVHVAAAARAARRGRIRGSCSRAPISAMRSSAAPRAARVRGWCGRSRRSR